MAKLILVRSILPALFLGLGFAAQEMIHTRIIEDEISPNLLSQIDTGFEVIYWVLGAWLFNQVFRAIIWDRLFRDTMGRTPPKLVMQLFSFLVFLVTLSCIIFFVFGQSVTALWAASGALGIVFGFALRNLLGDVFSGVAIQIERPFAVGDWIGYKAGDQEIMGRVEETNWRTTRLWTKEMNMVVTPNSQITSSTLINYSRPERFSEFYVELTLDFSVSTQRAKRILLAAVMDSVDVEGIVSDPEPLVHLQATSPHGIVYRVKYFIDTGQITTSNAKNAVFDNICLHLKHAGITLAVPRSDVFLARMPWRHKNWKYHKDQIRHLANIQLFEELDEPDLAFIADHMQVHEMSKGDIVVKQGEMDSSMFILAEGLLDVSVHNGELDQDIKVANLAPGTFFGEKSLLTGECRSATITCLTESVVCEISKDCIRDLLERNPVIAQTLARAITQRDLQNQDVFNSTSLLESGNTHKTAIEAMATKIKEFFKL